MQSGTYILGPKVQAFEAALADYVGCNHALGVANGTDALYLALRALGIGQGDEVITTSFSYIATSEAITRCQATPIFLDLDPAGTFNLDVAKLEAAITPRTKAILPVHLYGQAADMTTLMAVANKYSLPVVEDCAQALGARWQGQPVGSFGTISCFSFFPTKNLGAAGDAGAVATNDPALAALLKQLRVHGQSSQYDHATEGINSRLDELQAALLLVKLPHLDGWNQRRAEIAARYSSALASLAPKVQVPVVQAGAQAVFHQYTLQTQSPALRDALLAGLHAQGIGARVYYPLPLHLQGMHKALGHHVGHAPVAEHAAQTVLSLPIFPELTEAEQDRVINAVCTLVQGADA
jgi:dTDP-4-amino-4,6-dideoxygalactose transaminase